MDFHLRIKAIQSLLKMEAEMLGQTGLLGFWTGPGIVTETSSIMHR